MQKSTLRSRLGGLAAILVLATTTVVTTTLATGTPVAATAGPVSATSNHPPVVRTADGAVRGTATTDHHVFQGVPYASPPVGDLRFRAPQPPRRWTGIRDATIPGPWCPQSYVYPPGTPIQVTGAEDCLYLNIHVPREHPGPLPVMVFVHGGNSGSGAGYDPRPLSGPGGVIVVTLNYRLGALGFLRHPSLADPYAGNFGLADQQAALRWVRHNIATFGGDSANVTLWGESAGGFGVCAQLASPAAIGLFDKAIVQSAPCGNDLVSRPEADRRGARAVDDLGCADTDDVAGCLRAVPVDRLATLPNGVTLHRDIATAVPWFPTAGTPPLPRQPLDAVRAGRANEVPLIHGGTRDEMRSVVADRFDNLGTPLTAERYPQVVRELYGGQTRAVLARYPLADHPSPGLALSTLLTDEGRVVGACAQLPYLDAYARQAPTYAYEFAEQSGRVVGDLPYGAHHGVDIPYLFDSYLPGAPPPSLTYPQQALASALIDRWTTFARTGRPGPGWDRYRPGHALSISVARTGPVSVDRTHGCGFWRSLAPA